MTNLRDEIFDEPFRFDFFQAVRVLETLFPEKKAVGRDALPRDEVVRFRSRLALDFPASEIFEIVEGETSDEQAEMFVAFIGMLGASGVLPTHYTETATERSRYRDTAFHEFTDIFTHRAASLFFRAWEKYRFPIDYERKAKTSETDDFTHALFAFCGLASSRLRDELAFEAETVLPFAGLISDQPHSASAIEQILSDYFGVTAKIEQFCGQWIDLDTENVTLLGRQNNRLGASALVGKRIFDNQTKFRVTLGALNYAAFRAFLPDSPAHRKLLGLIKFVSGAEYDFDVKLRIKAAQVPSTILTTRAVRRPMLGWTTFLKTKPFGEDDEQVVLRVGSQESGVASKQI